MGLWYEIYKDPKMIWEVNGSCTTAEYTLNEDGSIKVLNSMVKDGNRQSAEGVAECDPNGTGACEVSFYSSFWGPYLVLDTDYVTYTLIYGCTDIYVASYSNIWILARERTLDDQIIEKLKTVVQE